MNSAVLSLYSQNTTCIAYSGAQVPPRHFYGFQNSRAVCGGEKNFFFFCFYEHKILRNISVKILKFLSVFYKKQLSFKKIRTFATPVCLRYNLAYEDEDYVWGESLEQKSVESSRHYGMEGLQKL